MTTRPSLDTRYIVDCGVVIIIADELIEFLSNQVKQRNNESNHRKKTSLRGFGFFLVVCHDLVIIW